MDLKKYDLYIAYVNTGVEEHNIRPVLIAENSNSYTIYEISIYNITHNDNEDDKEKKNVDYKYNYHIKKWQEAGLHKPSLIKIREMLNLEKRALIKYIGILQEEDIKGMDELIKIMNEDNEKALAKYNQKTPNAIEIPKKVEEQIKKSKVNKDDDSNDNEEDIEEAEESSLQKP